MRIEVLALRIGRQDVKVPLLCTVNKFEFELVTVEVHLEDRLLRRLAVALRIDVSATRQDEAVDEVEDLVNIRRWYRRKQYRQTSGAQHAVGVGVSEGV